MQAKLPDINSAIVRHRTGALTAMVQLNYALASTELGAINALLPDEYKVREDSEEYYKIIKSQDVLICDVCEKETEYNDVIFYFQSIPVQLQLLYSLEKIEVWDCPLCHKINPHDGTKRIIRVKQNPFYTGCMPNVPAMACFGNRLQYKRQFEKWFDIALHELESKIGLYRTDYAKQQDSDGSDFDDEDDNAS